MSLLYWWPFIKDGSNQGLRQTDDLSISLDNNGKIGKCALLTSSTSLQIPSTSSDIDIYTQTDSELSYAFWLKIDSEYLNSYIASATFTDTKKSINNCIIGFNGSTSSIGFCLYCRANDLTNSSIITSVPVVMGLRHGSSNAAITLDQLTLDTWYHIVLTYSGTTMKGYINGEYKNSKSISRAALASTKTLVLNSGSFFSGTSDNFFNIPLKEYFNDLRIYNHALSTKEVEELSKGLILHYKLDNNGLGGENIISNSSGYEGATYWNGLTTQAVDTDGHPYLITKRTNTESTSRTFCSHNPAITSYVSTWTPGTKFTISGYYKIPSNETQQVIANMFIRWNLASGTKDTNIYTSLSDPTDVWIRFEKTFEVPANYEGGAASFYLAAFSTGLATVYWKDVKMELGEKATSWSPAKVDKIYSTDYDTNIYDCSGYGNNGTVIGNLIAAAGDSPRYDCSTYISSGNTDYIITTETIRNPSDAITMNIWFKSSCTTPGSNYHEIFNHATNVKAFEFAINKGGYFRQGMLIDNTRYIVNSSSSYALLDGNWHMLTATYDGISIKRYIDGEIVNNMTQTITGSLTGANGKFLFGHYGTNTSYYAKETYISDARIYATALSAAAIKELYDTSGSVDSQGNLYARELVE